jgi:flavin-dependent dehydrogenase
VTADYDAIVCGAGPAGSLAALVLARAGARVLMLDRARFPRHKLCGDTMNPGALAILRRHALEQVAGDGLPVDGMIVTGAAGLRVEGRYAPGVQGRALERRELDARLVCAAVAAGARFDDRVLVQAVEVDESGRARGLVVKPRDGEARRLRARILIGADGSHSRIARQLGLARHPPSPRRWAIGAYFQGVAGLTSCGEMHVRRDRYIGVAPLPGGLTNVCVVTSDRALLRDQPRLLAASLRDAQLADRFAGARMVMGPVCMGPLAVECASPGIDGLLLAGDAAGFIDPMTGDGLRLALRSAELAAAEALRAIEHGAGDGASRLAAERQAEFAAKWRFNRALRALVSSPTAVRLADRGLAMAPFVVRTLVRYAGDVRAA